MKKIAGEIFKQIFPEEIMRDVDWTISHWPACAWLLTHQEYQEWVEIFCSCNHSNKIALSDDSAPVALLSLLAVMTIDVALNDDNESFSQLEVKQWEKFPTDKTSTV